jgi:tyrosine-specific transport protein
MNLRVLGGMLLVAGTTIGAGMLALPVVTGLAGFLPSLLLFVIVWAVLLYAAFLMLELNLAMPEHTNMITMAHRTLGPVGELVAWIAYLMLLYSLTAAYISGCGAILIEIFSNTWQFNIPSWVGPLPFAVIFGIMIYLGVRPIDYLNRCLMIGLVVAFFFLIHAVIPDVNMTQLSYVNIPHIFAAVPIVTTSFGFAIIIPPLVHYLDRNVKQLKRVILFGSLIPLILYIIWEFTILGVIPTSGEFGLEEMLASGQPAGDIINVLQTLTNSSWVPIVASFFSFFAIITSVLGVTLSLSDFLADGLHIEEGSRSGRFLISLLTLLPPLIFALVYPNGFILALGYASIFVAILLVLLPALMVWFKRYRRQYEQSYSVVGGRPMLIVLLIVGFGIIFLEFFGTEIANRGSP